MPDTTNHIQSAITYNLPSASDQLSAALNAPIPFFFAIGAVFIVIAGMVWKAFQWRYDGIIELTRTMLELARTQADAAKARQTELEATVKSLESKIEQLVKSAGSSSRDVQQLAEEISKTSLTASAQVVRLGEANNAVSDALARVPYSLLWRKDQIAPFVTEKSE